VRAFKSFIESPPTIKSLKGRHKFKAGGHEVFVEIRWQTNGFFVRIEPRYESLIRPERTVLGPKPQLDGKNHIVFGATSAGEVGGRYEGFWWVITSTGHYISERLTAEQERLLVNSHHLHPLLRRMEPYVGFLMNMGLDCGKPACLKWTGNSTSGTNLFGKRFDTRLKLGEQGVLTGIEVHYPDGVAGFDPKLASNITFSVTYQYDKRLSGWSLPTTIQSWRGETEVLAVELSGRPISRWDFLPEPFLNRRGSIVFVEQMRDQQIVKRAVFDDSKHGMVRVCGFWMGKPRFRRLFFLASFVLTASVVAVGAVKSMRKKEKETTYETPSSKM
jgi:hypothetical protein